MIVDISLNNDVSKRVSPVYVELGEGTANKTPAADHKRMIRNSVIDDKWTRFIP